MRMLTAAAGAAFLVLMAGPALAGDPRGSGCGGGCGHRPPPPPPPAPCCHGGPNTNINVNVNASARASASASASASSRFHARTFDVGSVRRGHAGGGVVYVGGGGYGGDFGGYGGGPVYYGPIETLGPACPSAPFGYIVTGFGRDELRPSWCGYRHEAHDRGGRYGYSERHGSRAYETYEAYESYEEYGAWEEGYLAGGYDRRRDCDCHDDRPPAPYPPAYLPEPPRYEPPRPERPRSHRPDRPRRSHPPRQQYRQEPGERG